MYGNCIGKTHTGYILVFYVENYMETLYYLIGYTVFTLSITTRPPGLGWGMDLRVAVKPRRV